MLYCESNSNKVVGYISITPPNNEYRLEKFISPFMMRQICSKLENINKTYELRSLTVIPELRKTEISAALCLCAIKQIIHMGGTDIIGLAAEYLVPSYKKCKCTVYEKLNINIGEVTYYLMSQCNLYKNYENFWIYIEHNFNNKIDIKDFNWDLKKKTSCYHGGSSWEYTHFDFSKRNSIIVADVLDSFFPPSPKVINCLKKNIKNMCFESPP